MEKSKVEFVYKNISSLNKISIVNKKIFRILPYICAVSYTHLTLPTTSRV